MGVIEDGGGDLMFAYWGTLYEGGKPFGAIVLAIVCYIMFPQQIYQTSFFVVAGTILLDTYTKMLAISCQNGGYVNARRNKHLRSKTWWDGIWKKLQTLIFMSILAGLSYRVTPLESVGVFLATFVYAMMFLREAQSVLENLDDAGYDVSWLLVFVKRKQDQLSERTDEYDNGPPDTFQH